MDKLIDSRFERVEKALDTLIKSISTYNPNPAHAENLVAADADLSDGLEQLTTHQSNYARIVSLRATSATLDAQIRDTLFLLSSTRKEFLATTTTDTPPNTNPVSYLELLSYARRISKFTLPPTYRETIPSPTTDSAEAGTGTPKENASQVQTNGNSTPISIPVTNGDHLPTTMETDATAPIALPDSQNTIASNNNIWSEFLNPRSDMPWTPWPSEDTIRRGALASIQILLDQGIDPATFDPEKGAELEEERRLKMEEEDRERERLEEERRREMERRMSAAASGGGARGPEPDKPKVFKLEDFEDDDD